MNQFVLDSNLPLDCSHLIICEKYHQIFLNAFDALQIEIITLPDNPRLSGKVAFHTDLSVFHAGGKALFISDYYRSSSFLNMLKETGADIHFFSKKESAVYPSDVVANLCLLDSICLCNLDYADPSMIENLRLNNKRIVPVSQGYTRCSVCIVDHSSIITADPGISKKANEAGLDVLRISPGHVRLPGYQYGFIGGATFKIGRNKLCFTGTLDDFPPDEIKSILSFLDVRNIQPVFLTNLPLFDIGSAVPLLEK